jgi:hypothetical protein
VKSLWRAFLGWLHCGEPACDQYVRELRAAKERAKERREARAREEATKVLRRG